MPVKLKTTGELREFIAQMMLGVKTGDLDLDKAARITKMAAQIHESFYSEVKVAKVSLEAGDVAHKLGKLPINSAEND